MNNNNIIGVRKQMKLRITQVKLQFLTFHMENNDIFICLIVSKG